MLTLFRVRVTVIPVPSDVLFTLTSCVPAPRSVSAIHTFVTALVAKYCVLSNCMLPQGVAPFDAAGSAQSTAVSESPKFVLVI